MDYGHTAAQFLAFSRFPKADAWFNAGPTTSYPDTNDGARIAERRPCPARRVAGCKVFNVSRVNNTATEVEIDDGLPMGNGDVDQVMVFQYKGKFVAVNHECPHASYPLSNGVGFDIEDFGVTLSSGITCPKHEWSFDMHTGRSSTGSYKLKVWDVEVRPADNVGMEVWVRRKQRVG